MARQMRDHFVDVPIDHDSDEIKKAWIHGLVDLACGLPSSWLKTTKSSTTVTRSGIENTEHTSKRELCLPFVFVLPWERSSVEAYVSRGAPGRYIGDVRHRGSTRSGGAG